MSQEAPTTYTLAFATNALIRALKTAGAKCETRDRTKSSVVVYLDEQDFLSAYLATSKQLDAAHLTKSAAGAVREFRINGIRFRRRSLSPESI